MKTFLIFVVLYTINTGWASNSLSSFETDYCTNYKEGTKTQPELWKHCCLIHDMHFWAGGNKQNRYDSDVELKSCIEETGSPYVARLMYMAVRAGSYSPIKYSNKKWNHGWKGRATFESLTNEDIDQLEMELTTGNYDYISVDIKNNFINTLRSRLE